MKLSKNLGRIATTFLATAMLAGLTAVPASAEAIGESGTAGLGNSTALTGNQLSFNSVLWLPENVEVPTATYTYTLAETTAGSEMVPYVDGGNATVAVKDSTDTIVNDTMSVTASFSKDSALDQTAPGAEMSSTTNTVSFNLDSIGDDKKLTFSEVGVYKYTLTQVMTVPTDGKADDFENTTLTRSVYLYVARTAEGQYEVTGAVMVNGGTYSKEAKSNGDIVNYYMLEGNPDDPNPDPHPLANELIVANAVDGVMGDRSENFSFDVKIAADSGKTFNMVYETLNGEGKWIVDSSRAAEELTDSGSGGVYEKKGVTLKHNQRIHIYGLTNGDKYTITGPDKTSEGYNAAVISGGYTNGTEVPFGTSKVDLTYTYTRNAITPTGLVMNVAPYVLLVLVAAGAGYVFLRKREED